MSLFSQLTGMDSQNAANKVQKANSKVTGKYQALFDQAQQDYTYLHNLFGQNQAGVNAAANNLNQDPSQRVKEFSNGANEAANQQAAQNANFLRSQGYGDGAVQGQAAGAFQQAATQANAYAQQQASPQEQLNRFLAWLQARQGAEGGALSAVNSFGAGSIGQVPEVNNPLAGILGAFAGNYASALGKKAGQ